MLAQVYKAFSDHQGTWKLHQKVHWLYILRKQQNNFTKIIYQSNTSTESKQTTHFDYKITVGVLYSVR